MQTRFDKWVITVNDRNAIRSAANMKMKKVIGRILSWSKEYFPLLIGQIYFSSGQSDKVRLEHRSSILTNRTSKITLSSNNLADNPMKVFHTITHLYLQTWKCRSYFKSLIATSVVKFNELMRV